MATISSLGVGSGLDLGSIISGLVDAERAPTENRLSFEEQKLTTELSAFGLLKSSLSSFQSSLSGLNSSTAFDAKKISLSDSDIFSTAVENFADTGSFSVEVNQLAKAHSLATSAASAFTSVNDTIGTGTLTVQFGTTVTNPSYAFTADTARSPQSIIVSAENNNTTLTGLRDYINDNDYGFSASIVDDGNGYRLLFTSKETGAENSMEITVTDDLDADNTDDAGLSRLAFNASAQSSMLQTVAAQDALLSINGLDITRDSNTVDGAINGVTLNLEKADPGNIVNLSVDEDRATIKGSIEGFVEGYNALIENINQLTAYNPDSDTAGVLIGDFTVRSVSSQVRSALFSSVSTLQGDIQSLIDIGIKTSANGTLEIDSSILDDALLNSPRDVEALFSLQGRTTDNGIRYLSSTDETLSGDYSVNITSIQSQGVLTGTGDVRRNEPRVRDSYNEMTLTVDGVSTGNITLTNGNYADEEALAAEMQMQINSASPMVDNELSVTVSYNTASDRYVITSDSSGSGSSVNITAVDNNFFREFGLEVGNGVDGTDLSGTINGQAAAVNGNVLTSEVGNSKGLSFEVASGGIGDRGTISITRGIASKLDDILSNFIQTGGAIAGREQGLNDGLREVSEERLKLDLKIESLEARLVKQFSALDALISQFNNTSNFLTQQLANLPKPNSVGNDS